MDITQITIQKKNQPITELSYDHFTGIWKATQNGEDASASLNPNRADKLLTFLDSLKTKRWLGPLHTQAMMSLENPEITISVSMRRFDDQGNDLPPIRKTLRISQTPGGYINFAKIDSSPMSTEDQDETSYFLLSPETIKQLSVELFE